MALVAYDYSDTSDVEEDENVTIVAINSQKKDLVLPEPHEIQHSKLKEEVQELPSSGENLFNQLPQPSKNKPQVVEDDDEFLHKKETNIALKPKAKITVPSLDDFKDVEGSIPSSKPKVTNGKKSGLLSMLPQPRNAVSAATTTKSFVPHVLTQKPNTTAKKKQLPSPMKKPKTEVASLIKDYSDDSDNDDEVQNDFFSIHKIDDTPIADMPLDIDQKQYEIKQPFSDQKQPRTLESYFKQEVNDTEENSSNNHQDDVQTFEHYNQPDSSTSGYGNEAETSNSNEAILDDEAIMRLCGTRAKRKREDIQIVDVNQTEVLADAREWLLKGLMDDTTKRVSSSKKRGNEPTSQQRRKHQITYLAHQAKANEAELQNQWANNRQTKRQTQSKYGF